MTEPHTLILLRHGQSEWNQLNLFTGWVDVRLSELGAAGSPAAAVTNAAFAAVGVCLLLFAAGVLAGLPTVPRIGALLVVPGGAFLVLCDLPCRLEKTWLSEPPVGIVTALLGCPFFVWLLKRRRRPVAV